MTADLSHTHAPCIHGDDRVIEIGKAALAFGNQLRVEGPRLVARDQQRHLRCTVQDRLLRHPVAAIGIPVGAFVLEMLIERPSRDFQVSL